MRLLGFRSLGKATVTPGGNGESRARKRVQTFVLLLLALNAILLYLVFRPPGASLPARQEEARRIQQQHEAARSAVEQMRELQAKLQGAIQNGRQFSQQNFLSRQTAFSEVLTELQRIASQSRLQPSGVGYHVEEKPEQELLRVEANMTVEGKYADLVRFINRLEQSRLFWIIESLSVSGSTEQRLRLRLLMGTYFIPS